MKFSRSPRQHPPPPRPEQLNEGIANALRSDRTPPFPVVVSQAFARGGIGQRMRLLKCLLRSVGPLALSAVAAGAFVKCVAREGWQRASVTAEDAMNASTTQVFELARYVEQANPQIFGQITGILARDPVLLAALGVSLAAIVTGGVRRHARRRPAVRR